MRTTYIIIWIMVIREISNKNGGEMKTGTLYTRIYIYIYIYIYSIHINVNTNTHILYTTYYVFINIIQSKKYSLFTGSILIRTEYRNRS